MTSFARRFLFAVVCLSGLGGCQSQGEGEHCDPLNNDSDCESGLQCSGASICCVPGTAACNAVSVGGAGSGGSSAADAATPDAATETSSPNEAATSDGAANDSASEAAATGSETSVDSGPANASDGAAE